MPLFTTNHEQASPPSTGSFKARAGRLLIPLLLFGAALLLGLYLSAPMPAIEQRLIEEVKSNSGLTLSIGSSRLTPLLNLNLRDLTLAGTPWPEPPLPIDQLTLSPAWWSLFSLDPAVNWEGQLLGGSIAGSAKASGFWQARADGLVLDLVVWPEAELRIKAQLLSVRASSAQPLTETTISGFELILDRVRLFAPLVPDSTGQGLNLGRIEMKVTGRGPSLVLEDLKAREGTLSLSGQGSLLLAREFDRSRVNLTLELAPTTEAPDELGSLLELFAQKQGDGRFRLKFSGAMNRLALRP